MIDEILLELKQLGLCHSPSEFSRTWLDRDQSYYRSLKWHKRQPSLQVLANCSARLQDMGESLSASKIDAVVATGERLKSLSILCLAHQVEKTSERSVS